MKKVLVTGASGFIGRHLVEHLHDLGCEVRCLVRPTSDRSAVSGKAVQFVEGSLSDLDSLRRAVAGVDVVFHLAGMTKALQRKSLWDVNEHGSRQLATACAESGNPPTLVAVSSLAAGGPLVKMQADEHVPDAYRLGDYRVRRETDVPAPVSDYGRSKLAGERAIVEFADRMPISIVRPPIVIGPADRDGLEMFRLIARMSLHLVPGLRPSLFSVVHVEDLSRTLAAVAIHGERCVPETVSLNKSQNNSAIEDARGVYFVSDPTIVTYSELGKMIGRAIGNDHVRCLRIPPRIVRAIALINQGISNLRGRPHILSIDKSREAIATGWACDPAKLQRDGAVRFPVDLQTRLNQTVTWYREQGWL